ncbi:MAG: CpaF family protein, partial [Dermatophilaceae bacterium]
GGPMDAVDTVESEVRQLIRRSGLDPTRDLREMRRTASTRPDPQGAPQIWDDTVGAAQWRAVDCGHG